ncbi:TPA: transposase [Candidatus Woesearchaeota archaeon]|nr:transposase [Candidatus Woesearchaeota archaeon]HIH31346.1 transposase [Candidatus Woesearchaeota archaeon]HIH54593.1 transposase [Candidatus Woesearchaeota archaeon]HIJ02353.1 transposase [Candidatus Woesearchaeota archaeon]HIJ14169.1 transposase [Candidatus Woesearchaeota archaeon]
MKCRSESKYNLSQENEIFIFCEYLPRVTFFVCKNDSLWRGIGAPPARLYDVLMNLSIKQYFGKSLRRSIGIIKTVKIAFKLKFNTLSFKTLDNYLNNSSIKKYLNEIIRYTSNPLRFLEKNFATNKTGERTKTYSSWYSIRCNKETRKRDHINVHITTGCELHPVVAINILTEKGKDNLIFREHMKKLEKDFKVNIVSGDGTYLSRENCTAVESIGGKPRFHLKKGLTKKPKGHLAWKTMLKYAEKNPEEYEKEYHTRSNVESTNHAKKSKFGDTVHCKKDTAKEQESHITWCCYNFTVLSRAYHELEIEPTEW